MIKFEQVDGIEQFDAAAYTQGGHFIKAGHREECEQAAIDCGGLYCWVIRGQLVIRGDFQRDE